MTTKTVNVSQQWRSASLTTDRLLPLTFRTQLSYDAARVGQHNTARSCSLTHYAEHCVYMRWNRAETWLSLVGVSS